MHKQVEKGADGRLWFTVGTHKMAYVTDTTKGLAFDDQSHPILISDPYVRNTHGKHAVWTPIKESIRTDQLRRWERMILPLELKRLEGEES